MFTSEGIITIIFFTIVALIISYVIFNYYIKISSVKIMLLGIGVITFSNALFKGMIRYGVDDIITIIGFSIVIAGFICKDTE